MERSKKSENALYGIKTWDAWKEAIKRKYNNPTEIYLDELFANYK